MPIRIKGGYGKFSISIMHEKILIHLDGGIIQSIESNIDGMQPDVYIIDTDEPFPDVDDAKIISYSDISFPALITTPEVIYNPERVLAVAIANARQ